MCPVRAFPDVVDLFLAQAASRPAHPAVVAEGRSVTYAELEERVRAFAAAFAAIPEPRVLIALPPGPDAYAAMLGVALVGGYYTPVNLSAPVEKLRRIAQLLRPSIIFGDPDVAVALSEKTPGAIAIRPSEALRKNGFAGRGSRNDNAYVIFTSGSTGLPKGVIIPRSALNHYVGWIADCGIIQGADRVSQFANIGFDLSVFEIYGALCSGAALFPVLGQADRVWPARMIEREGITVWTSVPSVISLMMQAREVTSSNLGSVRLFDFCGEPLLREHVEALFKACPGAEVQNTYGPTEATVSMTRLRLNPENYLGACGASIALGEPISGMGLHLVGGSHSDEGEIVITGPQLARGYWDDSEKTAQAFRNLIIDGTPVRGYFTGDWAERRGQHVFFKERVDFQVKVKGIRFELDEVAAAIRECGWPVVCVFKRRNALAAVVERCEGMELDILRLSKSLAERLEQQAIPEVIRIIDQMPRNENGKIDRNAVQAWLDGDPTLVDAPGRPAAG